MTKRRFLRHLVCLAVSVLIGVCIFSAPDSCIPCSIDVSAVYEPYSMTNTYKSGKYYENLSELKLSGDEARDVLAIAMSQVGYHEGDSDSDMHGESRSGTRDYVEYNVLSGKYDNAQGNGLSYGYYWCASFVNWCLRMAGVSEEASGSEVSCQRWYGDCKELGIFKSKSGYLPASGDMVFFCDEESTASSTHIGLVRYSDGTHVYTVEGNTSSGNEYSSRGEYVALKAYPLNSKYIVGYAKPEYSESKTACAVDYSGSFLSLGQYISEWEIEIFEDAKLTVSMHEKISEFSLFSVTSIQDGALGIDFRGKKGYISADIGIVQLTTNENIYVTNYIDSNGYMLFLPQYRRHGESKNLYANRPTMQGSGFVEWVSESDPSFKLGAGEEIPNTAKDLTLVAVWDAESYTVTFQNPDGTWIEQIHGYYGTEYTIPSPSNIDGRIFTGFDGNPDGVIRGNAAHTAIYVPEEELSAEQQPSIGISGCSSSISGAWFAIAATAIWSVTFLNRKRLKH